MLILKLVMRNCIQGFCLVLVLASYRPTLAEKENQIFRILKRSQAIDPGEFLVFDVNNFLYFVCIPKKIARLRKPEE